MSLIMRSEIKITPGFNNKIASFLFSLNGIKIFFAMLCTFFIALIPVLLAFFDGNFVNPDLTADIINDLPNLLFYLVGVPTMLLTGILYSNKFTTVLSQLKSNGIIQINEGEWVNFKLKANKIYSKWYYTNGPHLIALLVTIYLFITFRHPKNEIWYSLKTDEYFYFAAWAQLFVYYITFYIFSLSLLNIFASYRILNLLFSSNQLIIQPLHPDKCGGLASLGALSRTLIYWIIFIGVIVALNINNNYLRFGREITDPLQLSIIFGYLVMAYIIFFLPMHAAHKPMKMAKENEMMLIHHYLNNISKKFKRDFKEFNDISNDALENFNNLQQMYDITSQMPVYPYNLKTVFSFISSVLIPLLIYFLQLFFEKLLVS